jgi:hypothetical protein
MPDLKLLIRLWVFGNYDCHQWTTTSLTFDICKTLCVLLKNLKKEKKRCTFIARLAMGVLLPLLYAGSFIPIEIDLPRYVDEDDGGVCVCVS